MPDLLTPFYTKSRIRTATCCSEMACSAFGGELWDGTMNWHDIHNSWLDGLERLGSPVDDIAPFEIVPVERDDGIDWWPKHERSKRLDYLKKGRHLDYWETKKGILHTAELLFQNRGNIERQAAILIMASLEVKLKESPENWEGNTFRIIKEIWVTMRQAFPTIEHWHHASREVLPITIGGDSPPFDFIHPKRDFEIIYLFALEASLSLANWQLIRYVSSIHRAV